MGIIVIFIVIVLLLFTTLGSFLLYKSLHWLMIDWLEWSWSGRNLWLLVSLLIEFINLWYLVFFLNDARGDTPDTSIVWKFLIVLSVLISMATCWVGWRFFKL